MRMLAADSSEPAHSLTPLMTESRHSSSFVHHPIDSIAPTTTNHCEDSHCEDDHCDLTTAIESVLPTPPSTPLLDNGDNSECATNQQLSSTINSPYRPGTHPLASATTAEPRSRKISPDLAHRSKRFFRRQSTTDSVVMQQLEQQTIADSCHKASMNQQSIEAIHKQQQTAWISKELEHQLTQQQQQQQTLQKQQQLAVDTAYLASLR